MVTAQEKQSFENTVAEAKKYIAGGVVSLNRKVQPHIVFNRGVGSKIYDENGREYIDYHAAFAPHLLGHNYAPVNDAVIKIIRENFSLIGSGTNALEITLAKTMCRLIPSLDLVAGALLLTHNESSLQSPT